MEHREAHAPREAFLHEPEAEADTEPSFPEIFQDFLQLLTLGGVDLKDHPTFKRLKDLKGDDLERVLVGAQFFFTPYAS